MTQANDFRLSVYIVVAHVSLLDEGPSTVTGEITKLGFASFCPRAYKRED